MLPPHRPFADVPGPDMDVRFREAADAPGGAAKRSPQLGRQHGEPCDSARVFECSRITGLSEDVLDYLDWTARRLFKP